MSSIWNEANVKIPPYITSKVPNNNCVAHVQSLFLKRKSAQFDILQDELANTAALLSRITARRKNSFHNMNGFQFVCKINTALGRLLKLNVEQVLSNFHQMLPESSCPNNELPSRNNCDYVLLRIISVHKIFQRITFCCKQSVDYFNKLLKNNFFMETLVLFLAVIAKLWDLSVKIGNTYAEFYKKLFLMRKLFPQMDSNNSFENVDFPKELPEFLQEFPAVENVSKSEDDSTIIMQNEVPRSAPIPAVGIVPKLQKEEDFGMAICRDSMKPVIDINRIHNIDDIRQFFKNEDVERKKSMNSCATKYILKHEWLAIQKLVDRKIIANNHKSAISVFKKFITSKT